MAVAPFGPKVPKDVQDKVLQAMKDTDDGKIVVFKGPIKDQNGAVKVRRGETLDRRPCSSSLDWFVEGVVGSPK